MESNGKFSTIHVVRYEGIFGFIKPWTAVRDGETYSQQFLTQSTVEGMRQKLEVSAILRHRLRYAGFSLQQERTQARGWKISRSGAAERPVSIIRRHVLLQPRLFLAFPTAEDAEKAAAQHLCLCRSEDLIYPVGAPAVMGREEFDQLDGVELIFGHAQDAFFVGMNRYPPGEAMYGRLVVTGNPTETGERP